MSPVKIFFDDSVNLPTFQMAVGPNAVLQLQPSRPSLSWSCISSAQQFISLNGDGGAVSGGSPLRESPLAQTFPVLFVH